MEWVSGKLIVFKGMPSATFCNEFPQHFIGANLESVSSAISTLDLQDSGKVPLF